MRKPLPRLFLVVGSLLPATFLLARGEHHDHPPGGHHHQWRSVQPPDGLVRLVDERGRGLKQLRPAQVARIEVIGLQNMDQCIVPDCPFGATGCVIEARSPRVLSFSDGGAGGRFGFRDPLGQFEPLPADDIAQITYYRAPFHATTVRLSGRFDDTGRTIDDHHRWIPTYDDPPNDGRPWYCVVTAAPAGGKAPVDEAQTATTSSDTHPGRKSARRVERHECTGTSPLLPKR